MFLQSSLFGLGDPSADERFAGANRIDLDAGAWVEYVPAWLDGADTLFDQAACAVELRQRTNISMYD